MNGKACLALSAFIYGAAPMLAKIAYEGGANVMTLTFLRTSMTLPLLFIIMKLRGEPFRISGAEFLKISLLALSGTTASTALLYIAYDFIPTGLATTLHFVYPLMIILASAFIYHERIKKVQLIAVALVTTGIFMFVNLNTSADKTGIILALLSGICYSFYVVYMDYSGVSGMDYIKLTFYLMLMTSFSTLVFGAATDTLAFAQMDLNGWIFSAFISIMVTAGAIPLFQIGVRTEGASTAGIISAFEPITTMLLGTAFLGETMTLVQYLGTALILAGVTLAEKYA